MNLVLLIWLALSVIGLGITAYGIREAYLDRRAVSGIPDGKLMVADQRVFAQSGRFAIFAMWIVAALVPFSVIVLLVAANIALILVSISDVYVGRQLRR